MRLASNNADTGLLLLLSLESPELLLAAALVCLGTSLGVQAVIPPAEAGRVVTDELLMMQVVMVGAGPDGQEVAQAPGEVIAAVGVDGLEETQDDPDVHGQEVQLTSELEQDHGRADDAYSEKHGLNGRSVLRGETEGSRVGVMHLVDVLVQRAVVQGAVEPVVPSILHDEEHGNLQRHLPDGGEGHAVLQAEVSRDGVEEPDLWQLGGEVADEDDGGALPLLLERWDLLVLDLVLVEVWDLVHDHEGNAAAEVDNFVHGEAHDTRRESVILHKQVPAL